MTRLRGLIGSMQYAVSHTRPDLASRLGEIQVQLSQPTVQTLLQGNKLLREAQLTSEVSIFFRQIGPKLVTHVAFGDASFASPKQLESFQGSVICATSPKLLQNEKAPVSPDLDQSSPSHPAPIDGMETNVHKGLWYETSTANRPVSAGPAPPNGGSASIQAKKTLLAGPNEAGCRGPSFSWPPKCSTSKGRTQSAASRTPRSTRDMVF